MYCSKCGKQLNDSDKFCPDCGHPVNRKNASKKMLWIGGIAAVVVLAAAAGIIFRFTAGKAPSPGKNPDMGTSPQSGPALSLETSSDSREPSEDSTNLSDASNTQDSSEAPPLAQPLSRPTLLGHMENTSSDGIVPAAEAYTVAPDLSNVYNLEQFYIEPGSPQAQLLAQNMFYVTSGYEKEFYEVYEQNRYEQIPNFVTVDSMMHTYHLYFSRLMKQTEKNQLSQALSDLSIAMLKESSAQYERLKGSEWENAALRNMAFFTVGASLQNAQTDVQTPVSDMVSQELENIMNAGGITQSPLTGTMIDYSQFTPRGYYEGDEQLEQYFRAMMWYGQIGFIQKQEDLNRSALLMTLAMKDDILKQWEAIYTVTAFFAGASDDLSYYEYLPAIEAAYGCLPQAEDLADNQASWEKFLQLIQAMDAPSINSIPTMDDQNPETSALSENKGFRFMGQRFTIDAAIFQKLIYESVQPNSQGDTRLLPDTLDVAAALGSDTAYAILEAAGHTDYKNYSENMQALKSYLANAPETVWTSSLYSRWLYTLTPLLTQKGEGWPAFMQTAQWSAKSLETFAGSYAELKHDTVLYAKQAMAEMGGGEMPTWDDRGYVEPEVDVWMRFADLAQKTAQGLKSYGLLSEEDETNLNRLGEMAGQFLAISEKELNNTPLSDEEYELIRNYGGNLEHFWLEAFKDEGENITSGDFPAAIVTDIATDPNGRCLEVATGNPSTIYVIVPVDGQVKICVGAVYTFYQFEQPLDQRLTDTQWREMMGISLTDSGTYNFDSSIEQPEWTQSYRFNYEY